MNKCDLTKIHKFVNASDKVFLFGSLPPSLHAFSDKVASTINECEHILINSNDFIAVTNFLKSIKTDCKIMICDTSVLNTGNQFTKFLDENAINFSYSRQMLVNSIRERCMLVIYGTKRSKSLHAMTPASIFLVLRTGGGVYDSRYVNATAKNIRNHISGNYEIVCLTDNATGITEVDRIEKMRHDYPKWWGKVELFRDDISDRQYRLFLDLDTVLIDDASFLLNIPDGFYGIRDLYNLETMQTGIMKWEQNDTTAKIYHSFANTDTSKYINKGDHEWIGAMVSSPKFIQDEYPGEICSYKKHLSHITKKFMSPSVVCFHGDPRPHTVKLPFITDVWKY